MTLFLMLMALGLTGLALMALPGLNKHGKGPHLRHGHGGHGHGGHGHGGHLPKAHGSHLHLPHLPKHGGAKAAPAHAGSRFAARFIPEPRAILSLTTLYGAFGYLLERGFHLGHGLAVGLAVLPAIAFEWAIVAPLWRLLLRFEGKESSPLSWLLAEEAVAVTAFANDRGIVRVDHDGRVVQLSARLVAEHAGQPVKVGERLRIEDVDTATERVTVSLHPFPLTRSEK